MKVAIITQARMASTRLPGKVLKTIQGIPLLTYHIQRAAWSKIPIIVATSTQAQDNAIVQFCNKYGALHFRGDLSNVLKRYFECACANSVDTIIRITGDCPLIDGKLIKQGLHAYKMQKVDYLSNTIIRTFSRGFDFEIFSFVALEKAYRQAKKDSEKEHVTPFIWHNKSNMFRLSPFTQSSDYSQFRVTVDTVADFKLVKILIERYNASRLSHQQITNILRKHPEIAAINQHVKQKNIS